MSESAVNDKLFADVYDQLHALAHAKMSRERTDHTLQTTALVHEVYVRLSKDQPDAWKSPRQFFFVAAEAMKRILVERARRVNALKRGGDQKRVELAEYNEPVAEPDPQAMIDLDQALTELKAFDARLAEVVMLRYFAGLSVEETATALETSTRTVKRDWAVARAWLSRRLGGEE